METYPRAAVVLLPQLLVKMANVEVRILLPVPLATEEEILRLWTTATFTRGLRLALQQCTLSSALLMTSSSFNGTSGLILTGGTVCAPGWRERSFPRCRRGTPLGSGDM